MKLLVCNASWMKFYQGFSPNDIPRHGGEFVEQHGYGHEILNFQSNNGYYYGFIQTRHGTINIDRLGASGKEFVDGVTIVWRARSPSGSVIVGWYKNARVYGTQRFDRPERTIQIKGKTEKFGWYARAPTKGSLLIEPRQRIFKFPVAKPGFGSTTFVSFLDKDVPEVKRYRRELISYINKVESGKLGKRIHPKRVNQDSKIKVEQTAIETVSEYYGSLGFSVKSVEHENLGYDLLADDGDGELFIEVKGTSVGKIGEVGIGLTPNEYKVCRNNSKKYRICIVFNALRKPQFREFQWDSKNKVWLDLATYDRLSVSIVESANLQVIED